MSDEPYPDRMAVLKSITEVESNLSVLKNFVESYVELRTKDGPKDAMAVEFATSWLVPKESELELSLHGLAAHLPKMLAAGDQTKELVEDAMKANDEAATYTRELKEKLCPELFGNEGAATAGAQPQAAPSSSATGTINIKTMTGKVEAVKADLSDTIATVKLRYQDVSGTPPDQQRLIKSGTELKDEATLAESNIKDGDAIMLVLKLRQRTEVPAQTRSYPADNSKGGCCSVQ